MKQIRPFFLAMSLATAGIVFSESPAKALTWNFSYESDIVYGSDGYGNQSGSFVEPSTGNDGAFTISSFQFNHTDLGAANFDTTAGSSFVGSPTVTISGGMIADLSLVVNNPSSQEFEMIVSSGSSQATIFDNLGSDIDGSDLSGVTFTSGAGADYEHNPVPAVLIIGVLFAIKKLRSLLRNRNNSNEASESDTSREGASETGQ